MRKHSWEAERKSYMNKLLQFLTSLVGEGKLTAEELATAKSHIETLKVKLAEKDSNIEDLTNRLKPFEEAESDKSLKEQFIKAGGHESQFDKAKRNGLNAENIKDKINDFPSLKEEAKPHYGGTMPGANNANGGTNGDGDVPADSILDVV